MLLLNKILASILIVALLVIWWLLGAYVVYRFKAMIEVFSDKEDDHGESI